MSDKISMSEAIAEMAAQKCLTDLDKFNLTYQLAFTAPTEKAAEEMAKLNLRYAEKFTMKELDSWALYNETVLKNPAFKNQLKKIWRDLQEL